MKSMKLLFTLLLVAAFTSVSFGQVSTTPHNLVGDISEAQMPGSFTTEICAACHIPHNGVNAEGSILWSQTIPVAGTFTMYSSGTMAAGDLTTTASSLKCLGCHDNSTSIHGAGIISAVGSGGGVVGLDLSNDHPVGVALVVGPGLQNPTNARLIGGNVECGSCHNPHDNDLTNFMRTTNNGSALCLDCHIK